jgi:hypothetical protein
MFRRRIISRIKRTASLIQLGADGVMDRFDVIINLLLVEKTFIKFLSTLWEMAHQMIFIRYL